MPSEGNQIHPEILDEKFSRAERSTFVYIDLFARDLVALLAIRRMPSPSAALTS